MKKKVAIVVGTRPEGIKLAPIILHARQYFSEAIDPIVINTGQHPELLTEVFNFFKISPDYSLNVSRHSDFLSELQTQLMTQLERLFQEIEPDIVMVQGDTISTLSGALAAYYQRIPVAYVESGLRTGNIYSPFPEEANRLLVTQLATWHFTPTQQATESLAKEGIVNGVYQTGNTVVDAVEFAKTIGFTNDSSNHQFFNNRTVDKHMMLVTIHRRENWDSEMNHILSAVEAIAESHQDRLEVVWITHANQSLSDQVYSSLKAKENIFIYPPTNYPQLLHLMSNAYLILTDSGGIQEEAPSMNAPVLVARNVSERMEGVEKGCSVLVGTKPEKIVETIDQLIKNPDQRAKMIGIENPYGDGQSSQRILQALISS